MNFKGKATRARKFTCKDENNTTVACALCKRWVTACVLPSGIAHLKGHLSACLLSQKAPPSGTRGRHV